MSFRNKLQFSSVAQSCPTLCDPMNSSTPGLPVHHQLPEFTQIHVHQVSDEGLTRVRHVLVSLSELQEMVMNREAWHAAIHGVAKSRTRLRD